MFQPDWLIFDILQQYFEVERLKGHYLEVLVHLYLSGRLLYDQIIFHKQTE